MPNWCANFIVISHEDPAMLDRVMKAQDGLLMEFFPTPQPLLDTVAGWPGADKEEEHEKQMGENIDKYGYKDWYDWNVANWGTKWDFGFHTIERTDDTTVVGSFDSAWSPPVQAYDKLMELGFSIDAMYNEPGMGFCGRWVNGDDADVNYGGMTIEEMKENIDPEVDEEFDIIEQIKEWQEEEDSEEE
jgi:hypothetical protein